MTDRTSNDKEIDKILLKRAIASIDKSSVNGRAPSSNDLAVIESIAAKYPHDAEIQKLLQQAVQVIEAAKEKSSKSSIVTRTEDEVYSKSEYNALLKKEDAYFKKSAQRHEFLDKILSVEFVLESLAVKEIVQLYNETVQEKDERKASTELISYDLSKFSKAAASGEDLSEEEERRRRQVRKRLDTVLKEELFTAIVSDHVEIYATNRGKKPEDVSLDEVILAVGDSILAEFRAEIPKLKEAFNGLEEKLAALMFHSPEAIKEHHGNVEQLHREADKAHRKQAERIEEKRQENEKHVDVRNKKSTGVDKQGGLDEVMAMLGEENTVGLPRPKTYTKMIASEVSSTKTQAMDRVKSHHKHSDQHTR